MASSVIQAVGTVGEAETARNASQYNAQVAENNAVMARAKADEDARRARINSRKQLGDMRANYAASGVTMEGSPLDVLEESAGAAELDSLTIIHEGDVKAAAYHNEAEMERYRGNMASKYGYIGASGHLVGGGEKAAEMAAGGGG